MKLSRRKFLAGTTAAAASAALPAVALGDGVSLVAAAHPAMQPLLLEAVLCYTHGCWEIIPDLELNESSMQVVEIDFAEQTFDGLRFYAKLRKN